MNLHVQILTRILTTEFYRINAGFFLLVMGFCFGFMRGAEHMALAGYLVGTPALTLIPISVWTIYAFKVLLFNRSEIAHDKNSFLYVTPLLPFTKKSWVCIVIAVGQLLPAIAYGMFLTLVAYKYNQYTSILMIIPVLAIIIAVVAWFLHHALVYPPKEASTTTVTRRLDSMFVKSMPWMFAEGAIRQQPGMMYGTKLFACLVVYGVTQLYLYDEYDARLYTMAACAAFCANLSLVFQYQRFEVADLILLRSLPIPFIKRVLSFVVTMIILCFPEIAMLATNLPAAIGFEHYFYVLAFGISLMIMAYGSLYVRDTTFDDFTKWIFFTGMGLLMLILFSVPIIVVALVQATIGIYLYAKNYYSFEVSTRTYE